MNRNTKTIQEGFFSIEAMGSGFYWLVGMILAFSAVGVLYALSGSNQEIQNTNQLLQVARHFKSSSGYGTGDLTAAMIKLNLIPVKKGSKDNTISNTHGGDITIKGEGNGYSLTSTKLPDSDCIRLSTNISRGSLVDKTKINSTETTGEVSAAVAVNCCTGNSNTITFYTKS